MQQILTNSSAAGGWVIVAGGKKFGPYVSEQAASVALQTGGLMLTEQERGMAQIVPVTSDGQQILLG